MDDQGDPLVHIQGLEQGVEVAAVLDEAIRAGATVRQLVGVAHADQVGSDAAASWPQVRQTRCARGTTRWDCRAAARWGGPLPPLRTPSPCRGPAAAAFGRDLPRKSCSCLLKIGLCGPWHYDYGLGRAHSSRFR